MNKYELLYIVPAQYTDEEVVKIQSEISALVEEVGGKVIRDENLGKIRLAYPIKKARHGTYILVYFDAEGSVLSELDRRLRLADEVLRHTVLERPIGAEEAKFELSSYVAPLSEEAKQTPRGVKSESSKKKSAELPPPPPATRTAVESTMTMQELDEQLDKILEGDIGDNI